MCTWTHLLCVFRSDVHLSSQGYGHEIIYRFGGFLRALIRVMLRDVVDA